MLSRGKVPVNEVSHDSATDIIDTETHRPLPGRRESDDRHRIEGIGIILIECERLR